MTRWGPALGLSLLAHALALAGLVHLVHLARLPDAPAAVSRKRQAVMSVSLRQVRPAAARPEQPPHPAGLATRAPPSVPPAPPAPARAQEPAHRVEVVQQAWAPQVRHEIAPDIAVPAASATTASSSAAAAAEPPPEAQASPQPSARFANLFAPVIGRPLGRGRWQPRQQALPPPEQTQAMQMAQALAAARDALNQRTAQINAVLQQVPLRGRVCWLRIDLPARAAHIQCEHAEDHARLQSMLDGLVRSVSGSEALHDSICLQASPHQLAWARCPAQDMPADTGAAPRQDTAS